MRNIVIAFMACAGLFFSCTQANVEENSTGTLTGIVADKTTGEPVSVVNVILTPGGNSTVTGSDGSFSFKNLKAGTYTISYTKDGYKGGSSEISVEAGLEAQAHLLIERIPAVLTLDRDVLDFGENASMNTLSFNMVNNNYIDLEYTIIENCGWIVDVDPETGVLPFGKTGTVVVKIDREAGLQPGMNETVIVVKTSDGSSELTVRATGIEKRKATLNVLDATEVMASSARLNAEITDAGAPSYTERGFVYSESPMPDFDNTIAKMSASVTDDKTFSVKIDGLELSRTYYVRAYAVNEIGDAFSSNQISFTTAASLPEVSLDGINTNVSEKSATLYGSITNDGDPEYYAKGFVYSTGNTYPTIYDTKIQVDGDNHGNFEASLPSIEYDTEYYVRAYATNVAGTAYSDMQKIMIETRLPVVSTSISSVDRENNIAVLYGKVSDEGVPGYTERGFVYSEIYENPTIYDSKIVVDGTGTGGYEYMPYVIVIIDEIADLKMIADEDIETPITKLAQLARAVGIHLIIATQRPNYNIITTNVRVNFPACIAFRVATQPDSRVIISNPDASKLLGKGDMLFSRICQTSHGCNVHSLMKGRYIKWLILLQNKNKSINLCKL